MDGFLVYFSLEHWIFEYGWSYFSTSLNDNWIGILKHVGYSIKKFCNKRSITILCQQIFQKVASPQTGTHLGQDPIPVDTRWGNPILQKTPWTKSHVSNFPQKEHPDFQGWKNIQKKHGFVDFRSRGFMLRFTVYQQLPRLAANHTHFQHLGVIPEIGPNECEPMSCWQENHMFQLGTWVRWHRWHVFTPHDATSALKVWKRRETQKKTPNN